MSHLRAVGEVRDDNGMASTVLAEAVDYPGSSVAFAQLLSGMERSGLIERQVRGRRTYRIAPAVIAAGGSGVPARAASRRRTATAPAGSEESGSAPAAGRAGDGIPATDEGVQGLVVAAKGAEDFDYDELARRLLVQVVRRLAASPATASSGAGPAPRAEPAVTADGQPQKDTVASLEQKLVSAKSRQRRLSAENTKLREQLREAQHSLALAHERSSRAGITDQLDSAEVVLLERLLSSAREKTGHREQAGAS
jgi:hypothetical protein